MDADLDAILKVIGDPEVMKFSVSGPKSRNGGQKLIAANQHRYVRDGMGQWAVVLKETGACVGECGICVQHIDGVPEYEISYRVLRSLWGQGLGTEAACACRDYGFNALGLRRLISIIERENEPSIRVARKMGMTLEKSSIFHGIPVEIFSIEKAGSK